VIRFQISEALADIKAVAPEVLVIAYEPVWAIGTGTPATAADAMIVNTLIRDEVVKLGVCRDVGCPADLIRWQCQTGQYRNLLARAGH